MADVTLGAETPLRRAPAVLAEHVGGETVLLDPVADRYTRLNGTGAWLFERLAEPQTPAQLADDLIASRGAPADRALDDVLAFVGDLVRRGVVEPN
jgi:hypothetical protein